MESTVFEHSKAFTLKNSIDYMDGSVVSKIIRKDKAGNLTLFAFDKGQGLSEHTASFDAIIQIVEGKAKIFINRKEHLLSENEVIIMPANIPHSVEAIEKFKMLLIMIKEA